MANLATLGRWPQGGLGRVRAVAHHPVHGGDLGLGREMHCKSWAGKVACYVTNYSGVAGFPAFGVDPTAQLDSARRR